MPTADDLQRRIEAYGDGSVWAAGFEGMSRIQQHRLVYDVFGDEVGGPIHALSITTRTSQ